MCESKYSAFRFALSDLLHAHPMGEMPQEQEKRWAEQVRMQGKEEDM